MSSQLRSRGRFYCLSADGRHVPHGTGFLIDGKQSPFLVGASDLFEADVVIILGPAHTHTALSLDSTKDVVLIELGSGCLGMHTGEEGSNVLGFARYRNGPTRVATNNLVQIEILILSSALVNLPRPCLTAPLPFSRHHTQTPKSWDRHEINDWKAGIRASSHASRV
jgi:hypothetical protein